MIDLTLDSILVPDITGYTPPFGTKIARTAVNKGGLSTQQVHNNIIAGFVKMRGVVVDTSDTTSSVEYDAKIIIEATQAITLTLAAASYRGCRLNIVNNTSYTHTLSCASVSTNTPHILPNANIEIMWNGTAWQAVGGINVGQTYAQEPKQESPFDVFPCSDWVELISHNGTFKRAANAPTTLYSPEGTKFYRDAELTNPVEWQGILNANGTAGTVTDSGNTTTNSKGQTVKIYTGSWTSGNAANYIEKSGNLSAQGDQNRSHNHGGATGYYNTNHYHTGTTGWMNQNWEHSHPINVNIHGAPDGWDDYYWSNNNMYWSRTQSSSTPYTDAVNTNHTHNFGTNWQSDQRAGDGNVAEPNHAHSIPADGGTECRPKNYTIRIWKRIA